MMPTALQNYPPEIRHGDIEILLNARNVAGMYEFAGEARTVRVLATGWRPGGWASVDVSNGSTRCTIRYPDGTDPAFVYATFRVGQNVSVSKLVPSSVPNPKPPVALNRVRR